MFWKSIKIIYNIIAPCVVAVLAIAWVAFLLGLFVKIVMWVIE